MDNESKLKILKSDLEIVGTTRDELLNNILELSAAAITKEGIQLNDTVEDGMLQINYAAFLYRKRRNDVMVMPRALRYMLNNRLLSAKGKSE